MTLRNLPAVEASRLPEPFAFAPDDDAVARWECGIMAAKSPENTISILDHIGIDSWTGNGVTSKRIAAALRQIGDQEVYVDINSPGGDFFEGVSIYNLLREHKAKVTVRILGMAASAASIIAMAGDQIEIGKAGFLMVHNAWVIAIGNRHDMTSAADTLATFDSAMANVYADRSGASIVQAARWMDDETWFNGEDAIAAGLADGLLPSDATKTDNAKAEAPKIKAVKAVDRALAKAGVPRSERRSLIGDIKSGNDPGAGTQSSAGTVTHDADEWQAAAQQLITAIRS